MVRDGTNNEWALHPKKKTQAVACVSMWCNRMLVNGSTANFEQDKYHRSELVGQALF